MYACNECGRKFKTSQAAEKATNRGCPTCGGVDIDLAPLKRNDRDDRIAQLLAKLHTTNPKS